MEDNYFIFLSSHFNKKNSIIPSYIDLYIYLSGFFLFSFLLSSLLACWCYLCRSPYPFDSSIFLLFHSVDLASYIEVLSNAKVPIGERWRMFENISLILKKWNTQKRKAKKGMGSIFEHSSSLTYRNLCIRENFNIWC